MVCISASYLDWKTFNYCWSWPSKWRRSIQGVGKSIPKHVFVYTLSKTKTQFIIELNQRKGVTTSWNKMFINMFISGEIGHFLSKSKCSIWPLTLIRWNKISGEISYFCVESKHHFPVLFLLPRFMIDSKQADMMWWENWDDDSLHTVAYINVGDGS